MVVGEGPMLLSSQQPNVNCRWLMANSLVYRRVSSRSDGRLGTLLFQWRIVLRAWLDEASDRVLVLHSNNCVISFSKLFA